MSMTRRDYELLAAVIAAHWTAAKSLPDPLDAGPQLRALNLLVNDLASELATDNPRFDRHRFLAAAMPL